MAQLPMYSGVVNSPETTITNNIGVSDTIIYVLDPARVPAPPNLMTLGTGTNAETVKVLSIADNALTVERGFQGVAKDWLAGTIIARNFTAYDHDAVKANIEDLDNAKIPKSLATAADQVLVSTGAGAWAVKTLAQIKTWLGLGTAAYTASTAYATAAQGATADSTATALTTHTADSAPHTDATNLIKTDGSNPMSANLVMGSYDVLGTNDFDQFITKTLNSGGKSVGLYWNNGGTEYRLLYGGNVIFFVMGDGIIKLKNSSTHGEVTGSPEGVVTAPVGSTRVRRDGGAATTLYVKESGTGNTGWKAVQTA